jgi:hypothetical protein
MDKFRLADRRARMRSVAKTVELFPTQLQISRRPATEMEMARGRYRHCVQRKGCSLRRDRCPLCQFGKQNVLKWLDVAYQERDLGLPSLKTDFLLDSLRTDLRLTKLVKRVGLPYQPSWRGCVPLAPSALAECQQIAGAPVDVGEHQAVGRAFVQLEFSAGNQFRNFAPAVGRNAVVAVAMNHQSRHVDLRQRRTKVGPVVREMDVKKRLQRGLQAHVNGELHHFLRRFGHEERRCVLAQPLGKVLDPGRPRLVGRGPAAALRVIVRLELHARADQHRARDAAGSVTEEIADNHTATNRVADDTSLAKVEALDHRVEIVGQIVEIVAAPWIG